MGWTLLGVVALHGFWDAAYGWAIRISQWLGGADLDIGWPNTADWVGSPTGGDLTRFTFVYDTLLGILALIGTVWAVRRWRAYQFDRWSSAHPRADAKARDGLVGEDLAGGALAAGERAFQQPREGPGRAFAGEHERAVISASAGSWPPAAGTE